MKTQKKNGTQDMKIEHSEEGMILNDEEDKYDDVLDEK